MKSTPIQVVKKKNHVLTEYRTWLAGSADRLDSTRPRTLTQLVEITSIQEKRNTRFEKDSLSTDKQQRTEVTPVYLPQFLLTLTGQDTPQ